MAIYKCVSTLPDDTHVEKAVTVTRVVEAANVAAARSHVAKEIITVEVCDTAEAMRLAGEGVKLERTEQAA